MQGYFSLILHAHLPFVRHPEHERFLEEHWLYEAIVECYLPLLQMLQGWSKDGLHAPITLSFSPPLLAMLRDPLLQTRATRHLDGLVELADKEIYRTAWDGPTRDLAWMYHRRFVSLRESWLECGRDLVGAFRRLLEEDRIEIITSAATHAVLPLLAGHPPSIRAQILLARDYYRECFGREPEGLWLPECAYSEALDPILQEANFRWFVVDTHGLLHARPRPRYGVFAPVYTPNGLAAFGRDFDSAKQVWSRQEGYPGHPEYRDFYRDIGYDLDLDYVKPYLPAPEHRGFTGIKYQAISSSPEHKRVYNRPAALRQVADHAGHFLEARLQQVRRLGGIMDQPPLVVAPYDAELFGHWWYEGPEFLDGFVRKSLADPQGLTLTTPSRFLRTHPNQQVAQPGASSWGQEGYYKVWLNEGTQWMYPHLEVAQARLTELARAHPKAHGTTARALKQAARELLLAQSSDWPFLIHTNTSPGYARRRVTDHLVRVQHLYQQLTAGTGEVDWLKQVEARDNLFANLDYSYWA